MPGVCFVYVLSEAINLVQLHSMTDYVVVNFYCALSRVLWFLVSHAGVCVSCSHASQLQSDMFSVLLLT